MNELKISGNYYNDVLNAEQKPLIWINQEVMQQKEENSKLKKKLKKINEIVSNYGVQTIPIGLGECPIEITTNELNAIYKLSQIEELENSKNGD